MHTIVPAVLLHGVPGVMDGYEEAYATVEEAILCWRWYAERYPQADVILLRIWVTHHVVRTTFEIPSDLDEAEDDDAAFLSMG